MHASEQRGPWDGTMELRTTVVEYEDSPDECTIYPLETSEMELMTTWISAKEESYVDLDSVL